MPPNAPDPGTEALSLRVENTHFRVMAGNVDALTCNAVLDRLESNYARVLGDLGVATMPVVTVKIWSNETAFLDELQHTLGVRYQSSGYVVSASELRVLNVSAVAANAVHEFCHAVSLALQPGFG